MEFKILHPELLADVSDRIGDGPVVMINLLCFRARPDYPAGVEDMKTTSRSAYYEGYSAAFRSIAVRMNISTELIYAGSQVMTLVPSTDEPWDDIVIVRYNSFADLRSILKDPEYDLRAEPHRQAAVARWRFIASRSAL